MCLNPHESALTVRRRQPPTGMPPAPFKAQHRGTEGCSDPSRQHLPARWASVVATNRRGFASVQAKSLFRRADCASPVKLEGCVPARNSHYAASIVRRRRVLNITTWLAATVTFSFGVMELVTEDVFAPIVAVNFVASVIFLLIPLLHRFGELVAPAALIFTAHVVLSVITWNIGIGAGLHFYFLVTATVAVLILGIERILLASALVATGAAIVIILQFTVPVDTGVQPKWSMTVGFVVSTISTCIMVVAAVGYALRERATRESDTAARTGGEEFTILMPGGDVSAAGRAYVQDKRIYASAASVGMADVKRGAESASGKAKPEIVNPVRDNCL